MNKFNNIKIKNKIFLLIFFFLLYTAALALAIILPSIRGVKEIKAQIIEAGSYIQQIKNNEQNATEFSEYLSQIQPVLDQLDKNFVDKNKEKNEFYFISGLERLANINNVTANVSIGNLNGKTDSKYVEVPIEITVYGNINDVFRYLAEFESIDFFVNIISLDISTQPVANSANINTADSLTETTAKNIVLKIKAITFWQ